METAKIVFLIISSIIGAGFISGKEIYVYFSNFGICGLFLIIPLFFLLYFFIKLLLDVSQKHESKNFDSFVFKNQKVYNIFCFVSFSIISAAMFAGINSVLILMHFLFNILFYIVLYFLCAFLFYFWGLTNFYQ